VQVDTWGGWVFINMDPNCEPLRDFLEPAASMVDPFQVEKMRYRWRRWTVFDCNWKTGIEAFLEGYHGFFDPPAVHAVADCTVRAGRRGSIPTPGYSARQKGAATESSCARARAISVRCWRICSMYMDGMNASTTQTLTCGGAPGRRIGRRARRPKT